MSSEKKITDYNGLWIAEMDFLFLRTLLVCRV